MRDPTRNPDSALGEATKIRADVHPLVASFRELVVGVYRKLVAGATEVKRLTSASREAIGIEVGYDEEGEVATKFGL